MKLLTRVPLLLIVGLSIFAGSLSAQAPEGPQPEAAPPATPPATTPLPHPAPSGEHVIVPSGTRSVEGRGGEESFA